MNAQERASDRADRGPDRYWDRRLDPLDWKSVTESANRSGWERAYATFLTPDTDEGIALLGDLAGKKLIELGCGRGYGTAHLAERGADVVGVDVSARRCAEAARDLASSPGSGRARFCVAQAESLPFADNSFELLFARDVLMYARPDAVAREAFRVLVPGGRAVFVEALAGNALVGLFRRWTSSAEYRSFTRHLRWREMAALGPPLELVSVRAHYLFSVSAFWFLFVHRSNVLHSLCLKLLYPLDRWLLDRFPRASRIAWRATALYEKPREDDVA